MGYKDSDDFWTLDKLIPKSSLHSKKQGSGASDQKYPDAISFAEIKQGANEKKAEGTLSFVSVPRPAANAEAVTRKTEFPESNVLVSARISPALSYSMRGLGFLKSALEAERYFPEDLQREDVPFDGIMTEREREIHVPIYTLMPTFREMSSSQKKWYEYWKQRQINKQKLETESSYFFLYVSEIVNFCEGELLSAEAALDRLLWLAENYCGEDSGVGIMLRRILTDCIFDLLISKELPFPYERLSKIFDERYIPSRPLLCSVYIADHVLAGECFIKNLDKKGLSFVLKYISDHDHTRSKYYQRDSEYAAFADKCFADTAPAALVADCKCGNKTGEASAMISASLMTTTRRLYSGVLMDTELTKTLVLEHYPVFAEAAFRSASGSLFKYIENKVRGVYGIKTKMSGVNINEERRKTVDKYFYPLEEKQRNEAHERAMERQREKKRRYALDGTEEQPVPAKKRSADDIIIDTGKASLIEEASWVNTAKLMDGIEDTFSDEVIYTSFDKKEDADDAAEENIVKEDMISDEVSDEYKAFIDSLDDLLLEALKLILSGRISEANEKCRECGTFLQAVTESINDKAAELIGDIVINDDNDIIEDYKEEISERIKHKWKS